MLRDVPVTAGADEGPAGEAALMRRIAAGDTAAFRWLVTRHTPLVHAVAWRMLGDAAEAEDVVQEAFTRIWTKAEGWTPSGGGLGGWLRRVTVNLCLDRLRKPRPATGVALPDRADEAPDAASLIDVERRQIAVRSAMLALPDRQRAALLLTYYEGVSNAEAAEMLDVQVKALESLLVRARAGLAARLRAAGWLGDKA